ncbi:DEAD/DEAH box RNA helicase [Aspergillus neoniger CBS 115656]|uniref:Pre-mRNA-processing ATP-dependent RNA helicase PRP5 n=2 Tax=Aspergillus subgen. Circumdati TaxID=2720871 RepID=A0A318Z124_ASPNB|nr:pre-mRNA-processing ATP-dependent RNA helicase Prp5 [Aspergillus neoniger CBS 115656]XP_025544279.1 pre-mRNA-processing ATP-dependent RNA helicase Prp5 [Aspergillus costaricaensis CBS 115574]PYH39997.1 pre-mRNA-processing ATP-dependent RNA helicase Prp5 [Aspergillus neoniger CBS 115656]RAK93444.1 pre-mRNA-processing ATP-dependent RNA helicase Prp5 [Aspergillus costaricaensis CBS 115574]
MARHGDTRSPSPVGSTYSSSRRNRRDDDRYERSRRDDGRSYRRSRSPERRYRERERDRDRDAYRRRDRSLDRRDEDSYRPGRRERSRDRRRSRERDDYRRRSRDRDYRSRREDSRDRARRRTDDSADLKYKSRRDDSRDRAKDAPRSRETSKPSTPAATAAPTEDEKRAERLAKLEAWKQKQAAEKERKQREAAAAGGARSILEEIDRKSGLSPAVSSPQSPATPVVDATPGTYTGKFDPKAIAKSASSTPAPPAVLGNDVAVPPSVKPVTTIPAQVKPKPATSGASATLKAKGNVGRFGLGTKQAADTEKTTATKTLGFGEEESTRRKLERLPTPPLEDTKDVNGAADGAADEDEDDVDMQDGTEEEAAAAARAAAERREERLQSEAIKAQSNGAESSDTVMGDAPEAADNMEVDAQEEEEVDPLDAFMSELAESAPPKKKVGAKFSKTKEQQPEALFGDEHDIDMTAVGDGDADDFLAIANKAKKKKDIPTVDHKKVEYESFRKKFYTEPSDLAQMSDEEAASLRLELDGIKVRGVDVPKPVQKWSQCGLGVQTLDVIDKLGYEKTTSIQAQAIPAIMSGRDVIGVAKTGSGKTIAFLIPMFRHIKDQRPLDNMEGPVGLIMTPTRELATQIHKDCKPFLKALNLRAVCAYGGAPIKDQIADLKRGAEIIVCTPGRMIDLLAANAGRVTNLRRVTYVVLDEADRMFDMGFEPQVMKIMANIRPDRQTVLFSATFPRNMEALARKTLTKPIEIVVGGKSVVAPEITQIVEVRNDDQKFVRLLELLGNLYSSDENEDARALIFVDRQEAADALLRELMRKGYPCMSIHGGKDQIDRDSTIEDFKAGIFPVLIATSVAARGLDVKQLKLVVNYDAPNHLEDYVHRAGRTGRAGNTGTAVTFLTEDQERYSVDIAKALKQSGQKVPEPVQKLVDAFLEKVKAGKEKASASGFGGKGLERLDQERDAARMRERRTYKTGEEGEDEEEKEEKNEQAEERFNKAISSVQSTAAPSLPGVPKGIDLDGKITVHKTEKDPNSTSKNPLDKVGSAVADIHARLSRAGVMRSGVPIDNRGPDAGAFHATLEINDFPQKARWAVTNRTNVAKILEATGTSITTKGSFYPTGKVPGPGENPKLYILVEGETELAVTNAMRELMRLLKEGTIAAADSDARAPVGGRYNVV